MSSTKDIFKQHLNKQAQDANKKPKLDSNEDDEDFGEHKPAPKSIPVEQTPARKSRGDTLRTFVASAAASLTTPEAQVAAGVVVSVTCFFCSQIVLRNASPG